MRLMPTLAALSLIALSPLAGGCDSVAEVLTGSDASSGLPDADAGGDPEPACTTDDECLALVGAEAVGLCEEAFCDTKTGQCELRDRPDDSYCTTGDPCVIAEYCDAGECIGGEEPPVECDGVECGEDPCGNVCGDCEGALVCVAGSCQEPCDAACDGKVCGDDGCGGLCGECPDGQFCDPDGLCQSACTPDCADRECGDDGCGGSCGDCEVGETCDEAFGLCDTPCVPDCTGLECGDDGCGGSCGGCADGEVCGDDGLCASTGPAACGAVPDVGCCDGLVLKFCQSAELVEVQCRATCGWLEDPGYYDCDHAGTDPSGADPSGTWPKACAE